MSQSGPPADAKQAQAAALQELEAAQKRKRAIDTSLVSLASTSHPDRSQAHLEASIFAFEGSYLEDTAASGGNIIKGFDNYLKPPTSGINKKKLDVTEQDRLFSTSSGTYQQSLDAKRQHDLDILADRHAFSARLTHPPPASFHPSHIALPATYGAYQMNNAGFEATDQHGVTLGLQVEDANRQVSASYQDTGSVPTTAFARPPVTDDGAAVASMMLEQYVESFDSPESSQQVVRRAVGKSEGQFPTLSRKESQAAGS